MRVSPTSFCCQPCAGKIGGNFFPMKALEPIVTGTKRVREAYDVQRSSGEL